MPGAPAETARSPRVEHARRLFAGIARGYDVMGEVLSFGQNARWRRVLAARSGADGASRVLDVATGTGGVAADLARRSRARIVGVDQSPEMLRRGREALERAGVARHVALVQGRAERLPFPDEAFDAVTFTYLLRYVDDPAATLAEMARVLRSGGTLASLEFGVPVGPVLRAGWWVHTRIGLPALGAVFSTEWYRAGRFLGPSISDWERRFPLQRQIRLWREAGIAELRSRRMSFGAGVVIWGSKGEGAVPRGGA